MIDHFALFRYIYLHYLIDKSLQSLEQHDKFKKKKKKPLKNISFADELIHVAEIQPVLIFKKKKS